MLVRTLLAATLLAVTPMASSYAAQGHGGTETLPSMNWSFNGPIGTYDKASLQRGYKIYREVCASCHSMKRVFFRNLEDLGYNEGQIKNIAKEFTYPSEPNEEGEIVDRPGLPSDTFKSPYANEQAAKYANNGALPPDLSLIIKARANGANYVYGLLTGYTQAPHGVEVAEGQYYNKYFPGNKLAMIPPLSDGQVAYEDGTPETLDQYARDVVQFLTWASDPHMEDRKRTGMKVLIFLAVFAGIMLTVKRKLWATLH